MLSGECPEGRHVALYQQNTTLKLLDDGMLFYEGLGAWQDGFCVDDFYGDKQDIMFSGELIIRLS